MRDHRFTAVHTKQKGGEQGGKAKHYMFHPCNKIHGSSCALPRHLSSFFNVDTPHVVPSCILPLAPFHTPFMSHTPPLIHTFPPSTPSPHLQLQIPQQLRQ